MHEVEVKGILSQNNGMNTYRGCSHGCIYCDSRSLCYGFNHDFEDIEIKKNASELLEKALKSKRQPCMIGTGSMCDPYLHIEEEVKLTRKCLEIIDRYGFGLAILTKSDRILRDIDLIKHINDNSKAVVQMTLTTYDDELCKKLEPNVCVTSERFKVLMKCKELGIPTIVWLSPFLPFINDTLENIRGLLDYCIKAEVKGVVFWGIGVTLRDGNREYFYKKLDELFPGMKEKYIRTYGNAYEVNSPNNGYLMSIIRDECRKHNIMYNPDECFRYMREYPYKNEQVSLF